MNNYTKGGKKLSTSFQKIEQIEDSQSLIGQSYPRKGKTKNKRDQIKT